MPILQPTSDHVVIERWAQRNRHVPAEQLPSHVNCVPALLRLIPAAHGMDVPDVIRIPWNDFFIKFDLYGLAFVFDDATGFYELIQIEDQTTYRAPEEAEN